MEIWFLVSTITFFLLAVVFFANCMKDTKEGFHGGHGGGAHGGGWGGRGGGYGWGGHHRGGGWQSYGSSGGGGWGGWYGFPWRGDYLVAIDCYKDWWGRIVCVEPGSNVPSWW